MLKEWCENDIREYRSARALVAAEHPLRPVQLRRPHAAMRAARWFLESFPGDVLYALKANNSTVIVETLIEAGVRHFDVASLGEIQQLAGYSGIRLHFMHPVKSADAILLAYEKYGVRHFALDSLEELKKIQRALGRAGDLSLTVRMPFTGNASLIKLGDKFGAAPSEMIEILTSTRTLSQRLGLTFHVGSQMMDPQQFALALDRIAEIIRAADVTVDFIDVGGGFPAAYPGFQPPPLRDYVDVIAETVAGSDDLRACRLLCEPGRTLVAEAGSLLVRVEGRRGQELFINDGAFGSLYDGAHHGFRYPVRLIPGDTGEASPLSPEVMGNMKEFSFWGPTCDSLDRIEGPFEIPDCVQEGDYLEIGQLGAYGEVLASRFNGGGDYDEVIVRDAPMMSLYD